MTTWRKEFEKIFEVTGDSFDNIITTLSNEQLDAEFDDGYGGIEGMSFTAWSDNYVYFPVCYDGSEWIDYVPRNPCEIAVDHIGGG